MITNLQFGLGGYDVTKPYCNLVAAFDENGDLVDLEDAEAFVRGTS